METEETYVLGPDGEKVFGVWYAKKSCHKCYGRGWQWRDAKTKQPLICKCMRFIKRVDPIEEIPNENIQTSVEAGNVGLDL